MTCTTVIAFEKAKGSWSFSFAILATASYLKYKQVSVIAMIGVIAVSCGLLSISVKANAAGEERLQTPYETLRQLEDLFDRGEWATLDQIGSQHVRAYEKDPKQFAALRSFFYVLPNEEYAEILGKYNAWVKHFPNSYVAHYSRARYYAYQAMSVRGEEFTYKVSGEQLKKMKGLFAASEADLLRSLTLSSRPTMSYFQLIRISRYYGTSKKARSYYEKSADIDPDVLLLADEYLYTAQPRWGGSFKELHGFPDLAMKRGLSADKVAHLRAHARYLAGEDYLLYGDKTRAEKMFTEVVNDSVNNEYIAPAMVELGRLADARQDFETSLRYYSQALRLKPNDVSLLVSLAEARRDTNHTQEALAFYDRAIALAPDDRRALTGRGWLQHKILGNNDAAYPDVLKAAKLGDPYAQNILGYLYWEGKGIRRNQPEALYWWTLSDKQKNETASQNLDMAKLKLGSHFNDMLSAAQRSNASREKQKPKQPPKLGVKPGTGL